MAGYTGNILEPSVYYLAQDANAGDTGKILEPSVYWLQSDGFYTGTAFTIAILGVAGVVTGASAALTVPYGTVVTALVPTITHNGVSVTPASGVAQDFTNPIVYTVTDDAGTTHPYTVTVTVTQNSAKDITVFSIPTSTAAYIEASAIHIDMPVGTVVTALVPTITHTGASVAPASGAAHNFTTPQTYIVTAADNTTKNYTITVAVAPPTTLYRMRAKDTSFPRIVYWNATSIDGTGAHYTGPGPLVDIVLVNVLAV
jgi:hypothetical protein